MATAKKKAPVKKAVENKARKFGSAATYVFFRLDGIPYLFTDAQLEIAAKRAQDNPEDVPALPLPPKQTWLEQRLRAFLDWLYPCEK